MQDGGFSKSSHFSNIWCFFKRFFPNNNSSLLVQLFSACFWPFQFLTQTEYFSKAIGFAWAIAFARWSIFKIVSFLEYLVFFPALFYTEQLSSSFTTVLRMFLAIFIFDPN